MRARIPCLVAALLTAPLLLSCSPAPKPVAPTLRPRQPDAGAAAPSDPRWLPGHVVAEVPEGTFGPYLAFGPSSGMTIHAAAGAERRWIARPLDAQGAPTGTPKDIGRAPDDAPVVVLRSGAPRNGFVALWVRRLDHGSTLETVTLDQDGRSRAEPASVAQVSGQIVWADVAMIPSGPLLFWAEQRRDKAVISSIRLDSNGKPNGQPTVVAPNARAWQLCLNGQGVALALVVPAKDAQSGSAVSIQMVDATGKTAGAPIAISDSPTAQPDVDIVRLGSSLVMAWTDRRETDNHVFIASLDSSGKAIAPPHALTSPLGEQALVSLLPSQSGKEALVAWEDLSQRSQRKRTFRLLTVDAKAASATRVAAIPFHSGERDNPEFAAAPDGWAVLTSAPACAEGTACEPAGPLPTYLRLDESLTPIGGAPLLVDKLAGAAPASAWNLACSSKTCATLVTGFITPAPVAAVPLPPKKGSSPLATSTEEPDGPPNLVSNTVVHSIDRHIAELAATGVAGNILVGWITYFVEPPVTGPAAASSQGARSLAKTQAGPGAPQTPGDPKKPTAAQLSVLALDASGKPVASPTVISVRALSQGGIAIAPGAQGTRDAAIAWVARDAGDPQVFVTRINADAKRDNQQMLTRTKGDAADAAIAWAGDGWVVAWVDWRDGNGEVYAAKVDRNLRKVVNDTRLTNAVGDAFDVSVSARGNEVFVTWSDPRESSTDGHGDPYLVRVQAANLARIGEEQRLNSSPHHARSPRVSFSGQDVVAGWFTQPLADNSNDKQNLPGPRFVRIDPKSGAPSGDVIVPRWEEGRVPTSFSFTCDAEACRGFVASSLFDSLAADAIVWFPGSPASQIRRVAALAGPPGEDVTPNVVGDSVFFADEAGAGEVRVRRAVLKWTSGN